jgi:N-acetylglucosamine kinase-like BadF-type ATPase
LVEDECHVLGVDGGGSGTRCVIADLSGRILARGTGGPSNPLTVGTDEAAKAIAEAIQEASMCCGVERFRVACMGVAGTDRPSGREALRSRLSSLGAYSLSIVSDAEAALAGATGCGPGVVVVAGTGSIAFGVNGRGETARAGGWGWRLGDEGSGYDIGRRALTAALRAHDGRTRPTSLTGKLEAAIGLEDMSELIDLVYVEGLGTIEVASLAALVGEAAGEGDAEAIRILEEAGVELGLAASSVVRRLCLEGEVVVPTGGVFNLGEPLRSSFERALMRDAPGCRIEEPRFEPAVGSALLALRDLGVEIDEALLGRVRASCDSLGGGR